MLLGLDESGDGIGGRGVLGTAGDRDKKTSKDIDEVLFEQKIITIIVITVITIHRGAVSE